MGFSDKIDIFKIGNTELRAQQAFENWISTYGAFCEIDITSLTCPRFVMTCNSNDMYQQAVNTFGELWVTFNDAGMSEVEFMSAYSMVRQKLRNTPPHGSSRGGYHPPAVGVSSISREPSER